MAKIEKIRVGTTLTQTWKINIDLREASVYVYYYQDGEQILRLTGDRLTVEADKFYLTFTQEEALRFKPNRRVEMQARWIFSDGMTDHTPMLSTTTDRLLNDELISYVGRNGDT